MKKKLLYLANIRLPTEKAHGIQIMKMCEAFAHQGEEVVLVVPNRYNTIKEDPFIYYSAEKIFKIVYLPTLDLIFAGRVGFWIQQALFALSSAFYSLRFKQALIYSRDELPLFVLSFLSPRVGFVWEAHVNRFNFLIKRVVKKSLATVTITSALANFFKDYCPNSKYFTSPDGIDLKSFSGISLASNLRQELSLPLGRKIVAYIGKYKTMSQDKGVASLVEIFPEVINACPEAFLLLVGIDAKELENVEALLDSAGIPRDERKVVLHVPHAQAMKFLAAADVVVMNYPKTGHFTSFMSPLKLFEYMGSGRPIVTSDLPSIREILNDDLAVFFPPGDLAAFSGAIIKVLKNYDTHAAMAARANDAVKNYTWDKRARNILNELQ